MSLPLLLLVLFYLVLIILNYKGFTDNKTTMVLTLVTAAFSTIMLCASNSASLDWSETGLDMSGYRTIYEKYDVLEDEDFMMYYLFYSCMYLGQTIGLSFHLWWTIMSILSMCVLFIACKIHNYSFNLFLATFMAYYEIVFFSGFKFFYGFCFLMLAYGFLFSQSRKRKLLFVLFTCMAGGFHMMYYFFLVFLIKPSNNPKFLVGIIVIATIVFTLLVRVSGSAISIMRPFFEALDNDHVNKYTTETVHLGFYLAVFIHAVVVFIAYYIRKQKKHEGSYSKDVETLYYTVLISLLFCPFYAIALTFLRLITAFSLIVVTASSSFLTGSYRSRAICTKVSLLMVFSFYLMRIVSGGFLHTSVIPYFDIF